LTVTRIHLKLVHALEEERISRDSTWHIRRIIDSNEPIELKSPVASTVQEHCAREKVVALKLNINSHLLGALKGQLTEGTIRRELGFFKMQLENALFMAGPISVALSALAP
jgi:hypothetical protein